MNSSLVQAVQLLETPDFFQDWLVAKDEYANVGMPQHHRACPLARFLQEAVDPALEVTGPWVYLGSERLPVAGWVDQFVDIIDTNLGDVVWACDALQALEQVVW